MAAGRILRGLKGVARALDTPVGNVPGATAATAPRRAGTLTDAIAENRARYESQSLDHFEDIYGAPGAMQTNFRGGMASPFNLETGDFQGTLGDMSFYTNRGRLAALDYIDTLISEAKRGKWPHHTQLGKPTEEAEEALGQLLTTRGLAPRAARAVGRAPIPESELTKETGLGKLYADVNLGRTTDPVKMYGPGEGPPAGVLEDFWAGASDAERQIAQQQTWHAMGKEPERAKWIFRNETATGRQALEREAQIYYIAYNRMEAAQDLLKKVLGNRLGMTRRTGAPHYALTPLWQSSPPAGTPKTGESMLVDARAKLWGHQKDIEKGTHSGDDVGGFLASGTRKQRKVFLEKLTEWSKLLTVFASTIGAAGALAAEGESPDAPSA